SRGHIKAWLDHPGAEVVMLVDVAPEQARKARDELGLPADIPIAEDYRDALAREDVDIVDICTPSHAHAQEIADALVAGKHIVTEKPTGYDLEECRRLRYYRYTYPEPKVAVAYSLRYYPVNVEVKRLLGEGAIGEVFAGHFAWNHPFDPDHRGEREHGMVGWLCDSGGRYIPGSEACGPTHVFDLSRYFMGQVEEVFSYRRAYGTYALAAFAGGGTATMRAGSTSKYGLRNPTVAIIQGTEGTIVTSMAKDGAYTGVLCNREGERPIDASPEAGHGDTTRTENIIAAITEDAPLICDLEDAIGTSEMLHALWDSYNLGIRVPVHQVGKTG
ncbi:MAG TPA: Gfo/Idh/MocA family oxidoreductase, partial [Armatimonadota bacterium]|nr:Gfo/Idh/MocA family oxidoreductase [Armatimonadota bacterium]